MSVTPKRFSQSQQMSTISQTFYTATNVTAIIDKMTLTNTSANAVSVTIDLVDYTQSAGVTERVISARGIRPGDTYICPEVVGHVLNNLDSIQGSASAAASITIRISGREVI